MDQIKEILQLSVCGLKFSRDLTYKGGLNVFERGFRTLYICFDKFQKSVCLTNLHSEKNSIITLCTWAGLTN